MLVFEERGKPDYPGNNLSGQGDNQKQNSTHRISDTSVIRERSQHYCITPAPQNNKTNTNLQQSARLRTSVVLANSPGSNRRGSGLISIFIFLVAFLTDDQNNVLSLC